jgi:catechol 2,3-dioxygenase-like lactoylglutathione lyase family enzyme
MNLRAARKILKDQLFMQTHHLYLVAPGATVEEVRRFYVEGLGLTETPKPESLSHVRVIWFEAGPIKFHIGYPEQGAVGDGHTALAADDLDAARQRLATLGYAIDNNVIPMGYPRFYVRDPWNNQFEILPPGLP